MGGLFMNRCRRCHRELTDQNALYGWRCAEILGVSETLDNSSDETWNEYIKLFTEANEYLAQHNINVNSINLMAFYEAFIKKQIAANMGREATVRALEQEIYSIITENDDFITRDSMDGKEEISLDDIIKLNETIIKEAAYLESLSKNNNAENSTDIGGDSEAAFIKIIQEHAYSLFFSKGEYASAALIAAMSGDDAGLKRAYNKYVETMDRDESKELSVEWQSQLYEGHNIYDLCYVASQSMVQSFYGSAITTQELNEDPSKFDLIESYKKTGMIKDDLPLVLMLIKGSIDMGMPVIARIKYSGSQHFFVVYGYHNGGLVKSDFLICDRANENRVNISEYDVSAHYKRNILDEIHIYTPK
jgi:hypothetical protein